MSAVCSSGFVVDVMMYSAVLAATVFFLCLLMFGFLRWHCRGWTAAHGPTWLPSPAALVDWALFGNLSVLGRYPHRALTLLSRQLGPVYSLRFGRRYAVVVNGRAAVRAAFSTAGSVGRLLDDRPDFELYRQYAGGHSISFGRRGTAVRLHRRLARGVVRRLITSGLAERVVGREASALVATWINTADRGGCCLDPADDVTMAVSSALFSMCYGLDQRIIDDPEYHQLLKSKGNNSAVFAIGKQGDLVLAFLRRFVVDRLQQSAAIEQMSTLLRLNAARVQHRSTETSPACDDDEDSPSNVLDAVLQAASTPSTVDRMCSAGLTHAHLTSMPLEFLSAGSETSSATLIWILRFMAMHPDVQCRVHAELDRELMSGLPVTFADRRRLPYVEAVVLEAMRLAPVVPLALLHSTDVDVDLAEVCCCPLTISAGSIVIANLWSVGRDPDVWNEDADSFRPERFLRLDAGKNSTVQSVVSLSVDEPTSKLPNEESLSADGRDMEADRSDSMVIEHRLTECFYPFGYGARRCVGEPLGRLQIFLFFATIMRSCRLLPAEGKPLLTGGESYGDVIRPAPYEIRIVPR